MGLPWSIHVRDHHGDLDAVVQQIWTDLDRVDHVFSTYRPDSDLQRVLRHEMLSSEADPDLAAILRLAEIAARRTSGWFDIRHQGRLDPSGIVKGWAAQRAVRQLRNVARSFSLNAGGDLWAEAAADTPSWRIGIEHPADPTGLLTVLDIRRQAVATSGRAHRGSHLWDPMTGQLSHSATQATVVGSSLVWADVLATAAAVAGPERLDRSGWPNGYEILFAGAGGDVQHTPGFSVHIADGAAALDVDLIGDQRASGSASTVHSASPDPTM